MTETALQDALHTMIETLIDARAGADEEDAADLADLTGGVEGFHSVSTYADHGMLTGNAGLVLKMEDGSEFQLTIVRRR